MSGSMHSVFSGLKVTFDTPLSRFSTVRIGGGARIFVRAGSEEDVRLFLEACHAAGCRYFILGGGSNVLFDDRGFDGAVLHFGREMAQIYREGNRVFAQSGARLYGIYDCCRIMISEEENFLEISLLRWEAPYTTTPVVSGMT